MKKKPRILSPEAAAPDPSAYSPNEQSQVIPSSNHHQIGPSKTRQVDEGRRQRQRGEDGGGGWRGRGRGGVGGARRD
ncbi:hypothetical protein RHMOL_Rhmol13G0172700 [Rhododendron molle]|uniref:Uncharacterized protein n=1 Tax=Rhododendron molle TaxID=49168 RepID=A0ACC0L8P1_RHOML|nr:hypothetical protein RHMOL_Rhmol13G0172700 [Rhododendron molle]